MPVWIPIALAAASLYSSYRAGKTKMPKIKAPAFDYGAELANLDKLYSEAGTEITRQVGEQGAQMRKQTAEGLAARGIYSSPVSEASFAQVQKGQQSALSSALANLATEKGKTRSSLFQNLLDYNSKVAQMQYQRNLAKYQGSQQQWNTLSALLAGGAEKASEMNRGERVAPQGPRTGTYSNNQMLNLNQPELPSGYNYPTNKRMSFD